MRCTALLRRGFALLRPRMSGAGVAFPVRFFSVHFRCLARPLQSITWHFFSKALLCHSIPMRCFALLIQGIALLFFSGASRSASGALLCISSPTRCSAFLFLPARCLATLFPSVAQRLLSKALQCISNPTRRRAVRFLSIAVHNISSPKHCRAYPIQRVAGASIAAAMRLTAYPSRCFTLRFLSDAFHCFALPLFALAKQNSANALCCFSTPRPRISRLGNAFSCRGLSVPGFSGAYPLGPLPAPISVLGEELPDPALGIEREPICPGCGLAHDAPYILEVCLRCVGVPLDDHFVVDMEDHPVSGLLEVV